jgi:fructose-bisphosphate aldolase class I
MATFQAQFDRIKSDPGFLAALDQSGGSTPKALSQFGIPEDSYVAGEKSMFDKVHEMRTRIITAKAFDSRILGAILFEDTMDREIGGMPASDYLWTQKKVVPFLKVDKGLATEENGVQIMKPIPGLDDLLKRAKEANIFGTKMRSVIKTDNEAGIKNIVDQQFEIGKQIIKAGLVPILEPEVDINSPKKKECEVLLKKYIMEGMNKLGADEKVMLKLSIPTEENFYMECIGHPNCVRVVALSGGYSRDEANKLLSKQNGLIASFSRALIESLQHSQSEEEFEKTLDSTAQSVFEASKS